MAQSQNATAPLGRATYIGRLLGQRLDLVVLDDRVRGPDIAGEALRRGSARKRAEEVGLLRRAEGPAVRGRGRGGERASDRGGHGESAGTGDGGAVEGSGFTDDGHLCCCCCARLYS